MVAMWLLMRLLCEFLWVMSGNRGKIAAHHGGWAKLKGSGGVSRSSEAHCGPTGRKASSHALSRFPRAHTPRQRWPAATETWTWVHVSVAGSAMDGDEMGDKPTIYVDYVWVAVCPYLI